MSNSNNHGTIEISKAVIGCIGAILAALIGGIFLLISVGVIQIGEPTKANQPPSSTVPQTTVQSECMPPEGLVELWDHTQYQWSVGTWGTPNIANFTVGLGTVDTNDPDFSEFRLWISPCDTKTHGYISGAQFWPKSPVNEMPYKPVTLGQIYIVDYIPVSTGLWSLGNPR